MRTKSVFLKLVSLILVILTLMFAMPLNAFATDSAEGESYALIVESNSLTVTEGKTIRMTARVTNVENQPNIVWRSSDISVATVDSNGEVKGVSIGNALITASASVGGKIIEGEFLINVVTESNVLKDYLVDKHILSYKYSYVDDFYYTDDRNAWQHNFGFGKIYDVAAPYCMMEYDYVRVFFEYEDKDWMLQLWKGQYGPMFYGSEIGIYNRPHSEEGVNDWTMYECPSSEDWINMEMTLYHQQINGEWTREFDREYSKYWWCTGFKKGHLRVQEPANELRLEGRITLKDEQMTKFVTDGLIECGFKQSDSVENMGLDEFTQSGNDVYICWQNISEAESTMAIKVGASMLSGIFLFPVLPFIFPYAGLVGILLLIVFSIL